MKKIALAALVTVFGYMSAQAQAPAKASPHDGKDGNHTYVVPAKASGDQPGVKHIANRSKTGKNNKALVKRGTAVKAGDSDKKMNVKPRPVADNGNGKKNGHHKAHHNNGKHLGLYKHTTPPVVHKGCACGK